MQNVTLKFPNLPEKSQKIKALSNFLTNLTEALVTFQIIIVSSDLPYDPSNSFFIGIIFLGVVNTFKINDSPFNDTEEIRAVIPRKCIAMQPI